MLKSKCAFVVSACLVWATMASSAMAQFSGDVVKIGVLNDMSGPYADITGQSSLTAVEMAVEDFGGSVLGRKIEVVAADHQNKPDVGLAIARRWYEQENVDVIIGLGASSVALAVRSYTREKGRLDIATSSGSSDLTGAACSATGFHWMHDTFALAKTLATATVRSGGSTWFFVTADYSFGHILEQDASRFVQQSGGRVVGRVRAPINSADFSSYLLQAQSSGAKIIALANGGNDTVNVIKTAREFGIGGGGASQTLASLLLMITDVHALGAEAAQGMLLSEGFYWNQSDETRAFATRFFARRKLMPNMMNAADYTAALHYLKSVRAAGTDEARAVAVAMRGLPINDMTMKDGKIRADGRVERDMYVFRVKKPSDVRSEWDLYDQIAVVPFADAFRPLSEGNCPVTAADAR